MAQAAVVRGFFSVIISILVVLVVVVQGATDSQDVTALVNLYAALQFPSQLSNWNSNGGDPCTQSWFGVVCSGANVTQLNLHNLGLNGNLGYSLSQFYSLTVLDVGQNNLQGNIPYQLPPYVQQLNLGGNQLTGNIPYSLQQMWSLTNLILNHNQLGNGIPDIFANLTNLQTLDLSFNSLTGSLPSSLGDLTTLTSLNVQNNKLSGSLPPSLANLKNLQTLNVEDNQFTGWIPPGLSPHLNLLTGGNDFSQSPAPPPPPYRSPPARQSPPARTTSGTNSSNSGSNGFWTGARIGGITAVVLLIVIASILLAILYFRRRKRGENMLDEEKASRGSWLRTFGSSAQQDQPMKASPPIKTLKAPPTLKTVTERVVVREPRKSPNTTIAATSYSVADLQAATNSFAQESLVGEGSLGRVYRGDFQDGQVLAVKKLDTSAPLVQNEQDFLGVVSNIARLRHANITELVGYCAEHGQRLLVYEYLNHGTLNDILHSNEDNVKRLSWNVRVKIALGAARALEYLHEVCLPAVVHRNFKSGNVLLDDELNPHVSDCGIADLSPLGSDHQVSPQIPGSFGYSAPEYAMSGIYTVKSDVYSFGVVMLELLTGRKPLDSSRPRAEQSLVRWATPQLHDIDALAKMVDPALKGIYPAKSLSRFADIIALCVQPEPEFRPPMSELVQALVRLMQRASLSKRRSGDDRSLDHHDTTDISG
ncbi:unnamed protein product [Sphagnum jensenii]|uniref:Protein kinase domain-containing protein n=1 Tax=Sphagnum jensenii TaxID=128206 RepID=A0ABP0WAZ6_9BRYO